MSVEKSQFALTMEKTGGAIGSSLEKYYNKAIDWCTIGKVAHVAGFIFGFAVTSIITVACILSYPTAATAFFAISSVVAVLSFIILVLSIIKTKCPKALTFEKSEGEVEKGTNDMFNDGIKKVHRLCDKMRGKQSEVPLETIETDTSETYTITNNAED